jgi:hypothetical protein
MSLLDTASLVVTPNGTKAGKLYSVVPSSGAGDLDVTRATTATRVNSSGLIESVASNVPRLDYTNGSCPSILVEPQRTNIIGYSEQFDNVFWIKTDAVVTANTTTSPDGTQNADSVVFTNGAIEQLIFYAADNLTHTISFYVKTNSGTQDFKLKLTHAGVANYFSPTYTATTQWQKFTFTQAFGTGGTGFYAGVVCDSGTLNLWGGQLEPNSSYATSYIPTTSASVTRNADQIYKTGISSLIGQTEGTIYFEADIQKRNESEFYISISDGFSLAEAIYFFQPSSGDLNILFRTSGLTPTIVVSSANWNVGYNKIAIAYNSTLGEVFINGVSKGTVALSDLPSFSQFLIGSRTDSPGGLVGSGGYKITALWKTRLTNTQLAQLTTI